MSDRMRSTRSNGFLAQAAKAARIMREHDSGGFRQFAHAGPPHRLRSTLVHVTWIFSAKFYKTIFSLSGTK